MPKRTDSNQAQIIAALREFGASVQDLSSVGKGCPDLAVGFGGKTFLMEVKTDKGKLNPREEKWHSSWRGSVHIIHDILEAIEIITQSDTND